MAHFAKINDNNEVLSVIYVSDEHTSENGVEKESVGQNHLEQHNNWPSDKWIKCSYNTEGGTHKNNGTAFRANYPNIGDIWDSTNQIFHAPQPFNSWTLNTTTGLWEAPITMPDTTSTRADNQVIQDTYEWDEDAYQADNTTGWVKNTPLT